MLARSVSVKSTDQHDAPRHRFVRMTGRTSATPEEIFTLRSSITSASQVRWLVESRWTG